MNHVATAVAPEVLLGRDREIAAALAAGPGRPVEFHAACGFGKSALLGAVTTRLSARSAVPVPHLHVGGYGPSDLRQHVADLLCPPEVPLSRLRATLVLDDVSLGPNELGAFLDDVPHCTVIIGCTRPLLGRRGRSIALTGLPVDLARRALCQHLGRDLTAIETGDAERLCRIVGGQPLRLRQAAALVGDGDHRFDELARAVEFDPDALDRRSVDALTRNQQRTLTLLAFAAGALLPADLVGHVTARRDALPALESLHERGLAERAGDRFGLPVRPADDYLALLTDDLTLSATVAAVVAWIGCQEPGGEAALAAACAALSIIGHAAEHGEWPAVARLAETIEPTFARAGRCDARTDAVTAGLQAAARINGLVDRSAGVGDEILWMLLDDE
jgi:hypothetical protein